MSDPNETKLDFDFNVRLADIYARPGEFKSQIRERYKSDPEVVEVINAEIARYESYKVLNEAIGQEEQWHPNGLVAYANHLVRNVEQLARYAAKMKIAGLRRSHRVRNQLAQILRPLRRRTAK
jgi:hypothetical protein